MYKFDRMPKLMLIFEMQLPNVNIFNFQTNITEICPYFIDFDQGFWFNGMKETKLYFIFEDSKILLLWLE